MNSTATKGSRSAPQFYNEQIRLRVFQMPCCKQVLCWVNPRLPTRCPECGDSVLMKLKTGEYTLRDTEAWIRYKA